MTRVEAATELRRTGHVLLPDECGATTAAWRAAQALIAEATEDRFEDSIPASLTTLAEYTMPTTDAPGRDFQVLHTDFGVPLGRAARTDVVRYTALFVDPHLPASAAVTRIVRLADLAPQRSWPSVDVVVNRLRDRPEDPDATEGVLARVVAAADGTADDLPRKTDEDFLCGLEFTTVEEELAFFARHGLRVMEHHVVVPPGRVLVFDNLACAHGRLGRRAPGELHQLCVGHAAVNRTDQLRLLRRTLALLTGAPGPADRQRRRMPLPVVVSPITG